MRSIRNIFITAIVCVVILDHWEMRSIRNPEGGFFIGAAVF